jgi:flagellar biogenesis protein FliO
VVKYGEFVELCLAVAFFAFGWYTLRRLREGRTEALV